MRNFNIKNILIFVGAILGMALVSVIGYFVFFAGQQSGNGANGGNGGNSGQGGNNGGGQGNSAWENFQTMEFDYRDGDYFVTGGRVLYGDRMVIPAMYQGRAVKGVADEAFKDRKNIINVVIEDGVETIGDYAFYGNTALQTVTFGNGIKSIGAHAFEGCNREFSSITLPEGVVSVGDQAFKGCMFVNTVAIPSSLKTIGKEAFSHLTYLRTVQFKGRNELTDVGDDAFSTCLRLEYVRLPDSVKNLGARAFYECIALKEAILPSSIAELKEETFAKNVALKTVTLGQQTLGEKIFDGCNKLDKITFSGELKTLHADFLKGSKGVEEIEYTGNVNQWAQISGLETIVKNISCRLVLSAIRKDNVVLSGVEEIKPYAFYNFGDMDTLTLPSEVTAVGDNALYGCAAKTATVPVKFIDKLDLSKTQTLTLSGDGVLPSGALKAAKLLKTFTAQELSVAEAGSFSETVIEEATVKAEILTAIKSGNIKKITVCGGDNMPIDALSGCVALEEITLAETITKIPVNAFKNCIKLGEIVLPDNLTEIGGGAFYGCTALESVTAGDKLITVGETAFYNCKMLTEIDLGASIKTVGISAFEGCKVLEKVNVSSSLAEIGEWVFYKCYNLTEINYGGDIDAWGLVVKGEGWADDITGGCVIKCTDGDVNI